MLMISRRKALLGTASLLVAQPGLAMAQANGGMLARLRASKVAKVGIANQPPFSSLNPDGSMSGVAPSMAKAVLERLGIPNMQGAVASYGELIPGMLAGRWDFVAASLTITKERCSQVLFSDPLSFEGPCIVSVKGRVSENPRTMADMIKFNLRIGVNAGGAQLRALMDAGAKPDNVSQFQADPMMFDALLANRIQIAFLSHLPATAIIRQRKLDVDMVFPVADARAPGAGNAFRTQDVEFHEAYQKELRALKSSGEFVAISNRFGFEIPPELIGTTSSQLCENVSAAK